VTRTHTRVVVMCKPRQPKPHKGVPPPFTKAARR
jgi:hypothetical protein